MNTRALNTVAFSAAALLVGLAAAGPLQPPAGPVAPAMKTLTEIEPRTPLTAAAFPGDADSVIKITQPGTYYLTADVVGAPGKSGIEIAASNVTIDLNGFQVRGVANSLMGVVVSLNGANDIALSNGSINHWGGSGFEGVTVSSFRTRLLNVNATDNGNCGFRLYRNSQAVNCNADGNATIGFDVYSYCAITNCQANNNGLNGIDTAGGTTVSNCVASGNTAAGIHSTGGLVVGCAANNNRIAGIQAVNNCTVRDNNCAGNNMVADAAGIIVSGSDCRIEGNNCTNNNRGVWVQASGNIVFRNTCSSNSLNWSLVANNVYGPIIDRTAPASAAVSGNSASSSLGSTDANANFTY
ncbi:MAG: right-handed parallel beta-helix repeat-containing protein [Phycisphaerales bacterium]